AKPFEPVTPTDKTPFESVEFRWLDDKDKSGWPAFDVVNLGKKPIKFMVIHAYAYDKNDKQVARTKSLNLSDKIAPGKKNTIPVRIGQFEDALPDTATSFDLCYDVI